MKLNGKKILIIDDDHSLRILLSRVLEAAGCITIQCQGVKEALRSLEETRPDLVILDLMMPALDGFVYLKLRRQNKLLSSIPVIVLSGAKDKDSIQKAIEMGAEQFLLKPFDAKLILQRLRLLFFKKENFSYKLAPEEIISVEAQISGDIIGVNPDRIKIGSQVSFLNGKSIKIEPEEYLKNNNPPLVCVIEKQPVEINDGIFKTTVSITGLSIETRPIYDKWVKELNV